MDLAQLYTMTTLAKPLGSKLESKDKKFHFVSQSRLSARSPVSPLAPTLPLISKDTVILHSASRSLDSASPIYYKEVSKMPVAQLNQCNINRCAAEFLLALSITLGLPRVQHELNEALVVFPAVPGIMEFLIIETRS